MSDATKRPIHIPPWQVPYLEKHRILELFHELARELVIQQPDDHVLFLKQILINAAQNRDTCRMVILPSPKVNSMEIANAIVEVTKQNIITEELLLAQSRRTELKSSDLRIKCILYFIRKDNAYRNGWILVDCIRNEEDAKAMLRNGILPTHVIHFIPPFYPPLDELIYCHVPVEWPQYRRNILGLREAFKTALREIHLKERTLQEIVQECLDIISIKPAKCTMKPRVILLGPRGCGRKTQGELLARGLKIIHIDFEHLICQAWMSDSVLGEKLRACKNDVCLHSELLAEVIHKRVLQEDCLKKGWVLTGFPFSKRDFEYLDCIYTPPNRVILLECDSSVCKQRILHRKINTHTGSTVNLEEHPEVEKTKELKTHPKDAEVLLDAEISFYFDNYEEIKKYCGKTAQCVNADKPIRWVFEAILGIILHAPPVSIPRRPFHESSNNSLSLDTCCCSPIPSQVLDCYVAKIR